MVLNVRPRVTGLVLAAGSGERLAGAAKAFLAWRGEPLLAHALRNLAGVCSTIAVGLRQRDFARAAPMLESASRLYGISAWAVAGGSTRRATLLNLVLEARDEWVMLHDVARPFVERELFESVCTAALEHGAASAAARPRPRDGVAEHRDGFIDRVIQHSRLTNIHTPQACRTAWLRDALLDPLHADEDNVAALLRARAHPVRIVWGTGDNIKITYPEDLKLLE